MFVSKRFRIDAPFSVHLITNIQKMLSAMLISDNNGYWGQCRVLKKARRTIVALLLLLSLLFA